MFSVGVQAQNEAPVVQVEEAIQGKIEKAKAQAEATKKEAEIQERDLELEKKKAALKVQEAETANRRAEADDILEHAPADLKSAWGSYRQKYGDRALCAAHKDYLEKLRKESPDDYDKEMIRTDWP